MWNEKYRNELQKRQEKAYAAGGTKRIEKQHASGKLTARERLEYLLDEGSFVEVGTLVELRSHAFHLEEKKIPGDGVITGFGEINGKTVYVSSEDFTVMGGTLGEYHSMKICQIMDMALKNRAPYISINDSGGARIEEGIDSLNGYGGIFYRHTKASGKIPQIAAIMGPCAGGACYAPAICDYIFMTEKTSRMFITGPGVVKEVTGEEIGTEELGGAQRHARQSGVAHFVYPNDRECLDGIRKLLSYLCPKEGTESSPAKEVDCSARIEEIVPDNPRRAYDVHGVIETFVDKESFFEVQKEFGRSIVIGYARLQGETIGIVASQPAYMAGSLDIDASEKAARFVRCCDCFSIPILTLVDVPGFMPGSSQEWNGIIRRGAKLLYAYAEAIVPKVSLIMRKAYGGAYIALNSKGMGADLVFAWPVAQIAVMGAEGAVDIIARKELSEAEAKEERRQELIRAYDEKFMSPYLAAARGYIDEVIFPEETGRKIKAAFQALKNKEKEKNLEGHGNIPL